MSASESASLQARRELLPSVGSEAQSGSGNTAGSVLMLTSSFPRFVGDSTGAFVYQLAEDLSRLGWRVRVLAPHAPGAATDEWMGEVRVQRYRYAWPEAAETVCYRGGALPNLRRRPLDWLKVPLLAACQFVAVWRMLQRERPDLLQSHWILPQGLIGGLVARCLRVPHVVTVHGSDVFALGGRLPMLLKRIAVRLAGATTVNSIATGRKVAELTDARERIVFAPLGIDEAVGASSPEASGAASAQENASPLVAFVGRLVEEKGVRDLIEAVAIVAETLPQVGCVIVGDGDDQSTFREFAKRLGVTERIRFEGRVSSSAVPPLLRSVDMVVVPSWHEAQGLVAIEALSACRPVIATDVGGLPDIIRDGETGMLVPARAPARIAEAIMALHRDPALAARLARSGAATVRATYGREQCARRFAETFERVSKRMETVAAR